MSGFCNRMHRMAIVAGAAGHLYGHGGQQGRAEIDRCGGSSGRNYGVSTALTMPSSLLFHFS